MLTPGFRYAYIPRNIRKHLAEFPIFKILVRIMYENQSKHYAINVFQSVMSEMLYFVSYLFLVKVEEIKVGFPRAC